MDEFLRKVELFAGLPDEDLHQLAQVVEELHLTNGEKLFDEGDEGTHAYIIRSGAIDIIKDSENGLITLATLNAGNFLGEMSLVEGGPRSAGARANGDTVLIGIGRAEFDELLQTSPKATLAMLKTIIGRLRATEKMVREQAKLAQLGTITTSVSYELDKPAPRTQRGAEQLRDVMGQMVSVRRKLYDLNMSLDQLKQLFSLEGRLHRHARNPLKLNKEEKKNREAQLALLLDDWGIENSIHYAPMMLNLGYEPKRLRGLIENYNAEQLLVCLSWLSKAYEMYSLLEQIRRGSMRVYNISKALKKYSEVDDMVQEEVDIYDELEDALFKFRTQIETSNTSIARQYKDDLPKFMAYPNDLNQVFVHVIENAIQAVDGDGTITVHPYQQRHYIMVDITDNGPGIPEDVKGKIFDPFFTTKNPGEAMGLGLHVSRRIVEQKHGGSLTVISEPGKTCVTVAIPIG